MGPVVTFGVTRSAGVTGLFMGRAPFFSLMLRSIAQAMRLEARANGHPSRRPLRGLLRMRIESAGGKYGSCPFAGMTRIRFKGCSHEQRNLSRLSSAPLGTGLM